MQAIANAIHQSRTEKELRELLKKLKTQDKTLLKNQNQIDQLAATLHPSEHSLGLSYLLSVQSCRVLKMWLPS